MSSGMNKRFLKDPVAFMQKYAVAPTNYLTTTDQYGNSATAYLGKAKKAVAGNVAGYENTKMEQAFKVAYMNLSERKRDVSAIFNPGNAMSAGQIVELSGKYNPDGGRIKAYWLPWISTGGIARITIPAMGFAPLNDDVKFFFTAAISGCSVFVKGTSLSPEVYHAGGDTKTGTNTLAGVKFWRDMIDLVSGPGYEEVNKTNYISDPNSVNKQLSTVHSEAFEQFLSGNNPELNIQMVSPWGCVMGMRDDGGHWRFYLQENASIIYTKFKKKSVLSKTKVETATNAVARPMLFRQFFPGGLAHVNFAPAMPRKI